MIKVKHIINDTQTIKKLLILFLPDTQSKSNTIIKTTNNSLKSVTRQ